nr:AMP-binding protein [Herpetosiphonaceae bacterium]
MANGSLCSSDSRSLAELLHQRADSDSSSGDYIFLNPDSGKNDRVNYQELDRRAGAIAQRLGETCAPGDRVLIVCPPGLDYIAAFFGCLYAQTIAVPAYSLTASRIERTLPRLAAIVNDAQAHVALTTAAVQAHMAASDVHPAGLQELTWIAVDDLPDAGGYAFHPGAPDQLAFLMYTSGSTGMPKGVKVTHANALHNLRAFPGFQSRPCHTVVSWLPLFHDLGLFLGVLHPLFQDAPSILMSPTDFVRNPLIWLDALSTYRGSTTGGPNFAYDLCVRKITPEQRQKLDLRPWTMALNGAEPIRAEVLERFTQTFAAAGFRPETFYPSYGMADATATVTGSAVLAPPTVISVDRAALSAGRGVTVPATPTTTVTLVGCGGSLADQVIRIVDPERLETCPPAAVGEIWVSGPSIGPGYWQRPQATQETFGARLAETGDRAYLRTGDLGFFLAGELFITGRLKDVIIVRGHNHYPEDIEQTIERSHPAIRPGCGVAFALDHEGEECLAVVQEVDPSASGADIITAIRRCVTEHHDIGVQIIVLIQPGSLPKTSSGKLQRSRTRERLLEGSLPLVARWEGWHSSLAPAPAPDAGGIVQWLTDWIAGHVGVNPRSISTNEPLSSFNLDSLAAVSMLGDLERQLGRTLAPTLLWSYPTIGALAAYLSGAPQAAESPALAPDSTVNEPIAIIGLGCNFPGAPDLAAFWQVLSEQQDQITAIPASRWDGAAMYDPNLAVPGKVATRWGGFLSDADTFDAGLFGISPREAPHIDPQHRKLLEAAWAALEHAGEAPDTLAGSATGVFIGICNSDHARLELADDQAIGQYGGTGTAYSLAANRLSYSLDLAGPSMAVDTACSSSLVALHLACQSLRSGESDRALIGGVNLILGPEITIAFSKARMMAADGRCKAFDSRADGYVRSEGVGVLVAKRLSQAIANGDRILALVRGSAISQDGRSNGITAPNGLAQQAVIRQAMRRAQISPANLAMIEAHGTGTPLGDAVEIAALDAVLGQQSSKIALGSVKTNIGHTEAAAGIAGVIKVVLAMMHDSIPAQLFGHPPNPQLNLAATALDLAVVARPWPADSDRRFAGVSSFGFGGTIAHVILEHPSAPAPDPEGSDRTHHLLALSGRDERALDAQIRQMQAALADSSAQFADICHTLGRGRAQLPHRLALVAENSVQAQALLAQRSAAVPSSNLWCSAATTFNEPIVFVFTGQGGQHLEMGRELYAS